MKAGIKTTEFWLTVMANIILVLGGLDKLIPPDTLAICLTILNAAYTILRTLAKTPDITTLSKK